MRGEEEDFSGSNGKIPEIHSFIFFIFPIVKVFFVVVEGSVRDRSPIIFFFIKNSPKN
mgnify:CR=1 FL=1